MTQYYSPETNLRRLIELVEATPGNELDLDRYISHCGTLHCIAGLAATDPFFQAQGLTLELRSLHAGERMCFCVNGSSVAGHHCNHMHNLFGDSRIFNAYGEGPEAFCGDFPANRSGRDGFVVNKATNQILSHKQLALMRLRYQLEKVTQ